MVLNSGFAYLLTARYSIAFVAKPAIPPAKTPASNTSAVKCYF